ncbi:sigma-70 family RNA polymerase sigma factor [Chryseomicrobium aureum]|uniref:sigma-70 family RNA polymerase sigma factor n=1 Tax=Chryseomicrobium aureum TaxID=1441723 RepID=UPI00370D6966
MPSFEEIAEAYQPMISSILRKTFIYKDHETFRQVAMIALWKASMNYEESKGSFAGYAYRCMYGSVLDELKKSFKDVPMEDSYFISIEAEAVSEQIKLVINSLPLPYQQVLYLSYFHGLTAEEIATAIGLSTAGVKKRKKKALAQLRELYFNHS